MQPKYLASHMSAEKAAEKWVADWQPGLDQLSDGRQQYKALVKYNEEYSLYLPVVVITAHGTDRTIIFSKDFFESGEYRAINELGAKLSGMMEEGAHIRRGEKTHEVSTFAEALTWMMHESRRGYSFQRYKGLGEMNPEQLWETTMDPANRRLLQVTIEDAIAADQMFTCLMGDQVEPRRAFIEKNALSVANLDI